LLTPARSFLHSSLLLVAAWLLAAAPARAAVEIDAEENALIESLRLEAEGYELGNGVPQDGVQAARLYCRAARLGDARSQFNLGWMYTNGRGVPRSDTTAAFFFGAAAEQGHEQAANMLRTVGGPSAEVPECMRDPVPPVVTAAAVQKPLPVVAAADIPPSAPKPIVDLVQKIAPEYQVQPQLALAIIEAESNYDIVALSPRNAKGLMQLIPATAERFNVKNPYDPAQNIRGGLAYLRWLLAYFEGDLSLVAAAYNAGEGAVERYRGIPPYLETRNYVRKVLKTVGRFTHPFDASVAAPSPKMRLAREPQRGR
jgi:soluble lytic murein transglycosylase-like protein